MTPSAQSDVHNPIRGLCFSYHHQNQAAVGSRRFRSLRPLLRERGIELDVICRRREIDSEPGVTGAGSVSPFLALASSATSLKRLISRQPGGTGVSSGLGNLGSDGLSSPTSLERSGLRSLIVSLEVMPDAESGWILPAIWAAARKKPRYSFIISTAPPWSSHLAAIWAGRLLDLPVLLDDRDPWLGSPGRLAMITHPRVRRWDEALGRYCYRRAAGIACVTAQARERLADSLPGLGAPITHLPNGFDPALSTAAKGERNSKLTLLYAGSYYHGRSPLPLLEAANRLPDEVSRKLHIRFIGRMNANLADQVRMAAGAVEASVEGPQTPQYCREALAQADAGILLAIAQPMQIPAKMYEYIGLGKPILSVSETGDAVATTLRDRSWAFSAPAGDIPALSEQLRRMHRQWSEQGLLPTIPENERVEFGFDRVADDYANVIRKIATASGRHIV